MPARNGRVAQHYVGRGIGADHDADRRHIGFEPDVGAVQDTQARGARTRRHLNQIGGAGETHRRSELTPVCGPGAPISPEVCGAGASNLDADRGIFADLALAWALLNAPAIPTWRSYQ